MSDFVNTIDLLGDDVVLASIVDRSITEFKDKEIKAVGDYAFRNCVLLKEIDLPSVTEVGNLAFGYNGIENVNIPLLYKIGVQAFGSCKSLVSITLPNVVDMNTSTFYGCTALKSVDLPSMTTIPNRTFEDCSSLETVNISKATRIGEDAFLNCVALKDLSLLVLKVIDIRGLLGCTSLENLTLPELTTIYQNGIRGCTSLTKCDFPKLSSIDSYAFWGNTAMTQLILRKTDKICSLSNVSAFSSTPIASGTGYIYVPSALVDSYKSAANWSTYANQFRALEDYTVDGTITGELDESKI